jgi:hypothetical protein
MLTQLTQHSPKKVGQTALNQGPSNDPTEPVMQQKKMKSPGPPFENFRTAFTTLFLLDYYSTTTRY